MWRLGSGLLTLLFKSCQRTDARSPTLRGPIPILQLWHELITLVEGTDADRVDLGVTFGAVRINRRAALWAERLRPLVSALSRLDVDLQLTLQELEAALFRRHHSAERRTGQGLTIGAVADRDRIRIDFSFITDVATMASAVDLHRSVLLQLLTDPPSTTSDWPVTKSLSLDAKNTSAPSRSSGYASRLKARLFRTGMRSSSTCPLFSSPVSLRMKPGERELTAIPYSPSSRDSARVNARIAPLDAT